MNQKELKRLSRGDLLEMLLELSRENDQLRREAKYLREQLEDRRISIEQCGSLAEAALKLNGVFQAAQAACEQYTQNVEMRSAQIQEICLQREAQTQEKCLQMEAQAQEKCRQMEAQTQEKCRMQERDTEQKCEVMLSDAQTRAQAILQAAQEKQAQQEAKYGWITELMEHNEEA